MQVCPVPTNRQHHDITHSLISHAHWLAKPWTREFGTVVGWLGSHCEGERCREEA